MSQPLRDRIAKLGVTPQGRDFLMKALYPCGAETSVSVPDQTWDATMRYQASPSVTIGKPDLVPGNWDMMIINTPGDARGAIIVAGPPNTDFAAKSPPTVGGAAAFAVKILSLTPIGAAIEKRYIISDDGPADPPLITNSYGNLIDPTAFRSVGRGLTVHCTASDLYNGGTVTAGQFCAPPNRTNILAFTNDDGDDPNSPCYAKTYFDVGLSEESIITMCPGAQTTEAKHGVFMPMRLLGPAQTYARPMLAAQCGVKFGGPTSTIIHDIAESGQVSGETLLSHRTIPTGVAILTPDMPGESGPDPFWVIPAHDNLMGTPIAYDTAYDMCATGVTIFRGLDPNATFVVQTYVALELIVTTNSIFRTLTSPGAPYDATAMRAYYDIANAMPYAYPASYNELGLILPFIEDALTTLVPMAAPYVVKGAQAAVKWGVNQARNLFTTAPSRNPTPPMRAQVASRLAMLPAPRPAPPRTVVARVRDGETATLRRLTSARARSASQGRPASRSTARPRARPKNVRPRSTKRKR